LRCIANFLIAEREMKDRMMPPEDSDYEAAMAEARAAEEAAMERAFEAAQRERNTRANRAI
jgi:hypothetical protein